jgi:hypothetical protein
VTVARPLPGYRPGRARRSSRAHELAVDRQPAQLERGGDLVVEAAGDLGREEPALALRHGGDPEVPQPFGVGG